METVQGITFTTKAETFKLYDVRLERAYYRHMLKLKGQEDASKKAMVEAKREIPAPACLKSLKSICEGSVSYVYAENRAELHKKYWWIGLSQGVGLFKHDDHYYIETNICGKCSVYIDGKGAGEHGLPLDEILEQIQRGASTEEEKEIHRILAKGAYAHGLKLRDKRIAERGSERYKPKRGRR